MSYPVGSCMPCTASPLCGVGGTSLAYGVAEKDDESAECDAFGATAAAHATRLANATAVVHAHPLKDLLQLPALPQAIGRVKSSARESVVEWFVTVRTGL